MVGGEGSDDCPEGEPFVRWEWNGTQFVAEDDPQGTTMMATEFKEPGEPVEAAWTSTIYNVTGAVVGAGGETCTYTYDNGQAGTVETCPGTGGAQSSLMLGSTSLPVGSSVPAILIGSMALLGVRRRYR